MKTRTLLPRRMPLRARLTLTYAVLFLLAGVVLLGVTYALFSQQIGRQHTKVLARIGPPPAAASASPSAPAGSSATAGPGAELQNRTFALTQDGKVLTGPEAERWMLGQQRELREAATTSLITQGAIALAVVGGVAAGLGWLIAGQMLAPLHRVTDTARRIAGAPAADKGLHERIALDGPHDEVKELADTFDTMLERLDRSFDGQRRFVANASHELRTPLTVGRALVEMAMHRPSASPDVRQLGQNLLDINLRHERLITGLLLLAGSEREVTDPAPVDLADIVGHVAAQTAMEAGRAGITVHDEPGEAPTSGDAMLLERLVQNLVENGIRHNTGEGGWVRVASRTRPGGELIELVVTNSGPRVAPYEVPALFEPFRRLGPDRVITAKGAGLGLSIVRSVARAHGGDVTARPREEGGLAVTVTLPACPENYAFEPEPEPPSRSSPRPPSRVV
ncbi:sensor histidine kinase [Actinomadura rugatobispora]|uniref:histidine kinase n=1 Tax=Actinomadura rugatobispora TaxID=1994 RepID=A0ABW1AAH7_9ACTN|nr:HAMP domain-containing sensor histidine kinase [Actinomadura rugatobispora]